jgi:membrane protease YdiL (CAAX protease family)
MPKYSIPRHIWRALYPVLIFFGVSVALAFIIEFVWMFFYMFGAAAEGIVNTDPGSLDMNAILSGDLSSMMNDSFYGNMMAEITRNMMWVQLAVFAVLVIIFLPIWYNAKWKPRSYYGGQMNVKHVFLIIGAGVGANLLLSLLLTLFDVMKYFPEYGFIEQFIAGASLPSQILAVGLVGPLAEELCMRGLVQKRMNEWMPTWAAVLFSSIIFGILHLNVLQGSYAVLFGVLLALLYVKYRTLWAPLIGHIAVNLSSILLEPLFAGFSEETLAWLDPVVSIALILIGVVCTVFIVRTKTSTPEPDVVIQPEASTVYTAADALILDKPQMYEPHTVEPQSYESQADESQSDAPQEDKPEL